jgi:hypothetical protein
MSEQFGEDEDRAWQSQMPDHEVDWDAELAQLLAEAAAGDPWLDAPRSPADPPWHGPAFEVSEDDWARRTGRRRPAAVRLAAALVAASLLLGIVGGTVGLVLNDGPVVQLAATVDTVEPSPSGGQTEQVAFTLGNQSTATAVRPLCSVIVRDAQGAVVGQSTAQDHRRLKAGAQQRWTMQVPLRTAPFAGRPADARVICSID